MNSIVHIHMTRVMVPLMVLCILLSGALLSPVAKAGVNPVPVMTMTLHPSGVTARPSDYAPGAVSISGSVTMDKAPAERMTASVSGYVDTGWAVQCSPSMLLFTTNKVTSFTVVVIVPAGTPNSLVGTLRVEVKAQGIGFVLHTIGQALVVVAPYYKMYLDSPMPYREMTPGKSTSFELQVLNMGNSLDTFDILVANYDELAAKGWMVSFTMSSVSKVGPMEIKSIRIFVQAPQGPGKWSVYKAEGTIIMMQAVSQNSRDTGNIVQQIYPLIVYEKGTYIPGFDGSLMAMALIVVIGIALLKRKRD